MSARLRPKGEGALMPFVVLGDPNYEQSLELIKTLIDNGADALELGFPFSDPIADGSTVQEADQRALASGMNTDKCFSLLKEIREYNSDIPIGLLVYYNLVFQRGLSSFCGDAKKAGVDALLIADMPIEESNAIMGASWKHGISQVFLVAPTTGDARIKQIASLCSGYLYIVSRLGVTGARDSLQVSTLELVQRVRKHTQLPLMVGFGISKPMHIHDVIAAGADGAIVGSALIKIVSKNLVNRRKMLKDVASFIAELKKATVSKPGKN